jgi:hypothetical protein
MRRDSNITQIARKMIARGSYDSFHDVLEAMETYLKGLGENYLPLARELAAIWSGVRNPPSLMLLIDRLKIKNTNQWITAVESGRIEEKVYKILVSAETFQDHGRGTNRSFLALSLYDEMGKLIERCRLFEDPRQGKSNPHRAFGRRDRIVTNAKPGHTYKLEYMIGSNAKRFQVEGLVCKILPISSSTFSYRMRDADGEEGLYIGSSNVEKYAHGEGCLEYDDGTRFVGKFEEGSMVEGVLYRGSHIRQTMKRGRWTDYIDEIIVEKCPSNVIVFDHAGDSSNLELKRTMKKIDDIYERGSQGREDAHDDVSRYKNQRYYSNYREGLESRGKRSIQNDRVDRHPSLDDGDIHYHLKGRRSLMDVDHHTFGRHDKYNDDDGSLSRNSRLSDNDGYSFNRHHTRSKSVDIGDVFSDPRIIRDNENTIEVGQVFPDMRGLRRAQEDNFLHSHRSRHSRGHHDDEDEYHHTRESRLHRSTEPRQSRDRYDRQHRVGENEERYSSSHVRDDQSRYSHTRSTKSRNSNVDEDGNGKIDRHRYDNHSVDERSRYSRNDHPRNNDERKLERPHTAKSNASSKADQYLDTLFGDFDNLDHQSISSMRSKEYDDLPPVAPSHKPHSKDFLGRPLSGGHKSNSLGLVTDDFDISSFRSNRSKQDYLESKSTHSNRIHRMGQGQKSHSLGILQEEFDIPKDVSFDRSHASDTELILPKKVRPFIVQVPKIQKKLKQGGKWLGVTQSGYLEDKVKSILISVDEFLDQNKQCNLGIALYNETGQFVTRCNLFGNRTKSKGYFRLITDEEDIVAKAKPGYFYQLQYAVNTGSIDVLQVKGWICKIFPKSFSVPSYHMADNDGDKGYYFGRVSLKGQPHGKGYFEYENGSTFVGDFHRGKLTNGAYYKIDQIKATMKNMKWTDQVDGELYQRFPASIRLFRKEVRAEDIIYTEVDEDSEDNVFKFCW